MEMRAVPHEWMGRPNWIYLTDQNQDPFVSSVQFTDSGYKIGDDIGKNKRISGNKMSAAEIVNKVWSYAHVLRDDGVGYGDYVEQFTYLIFLKMADEWDKAGIRSSRVRGASASMHSPQ